MCVSSSSPMSSSVTILQASNCKEPSRLSSTRWLWNFILFLFSRGFLRFLFFFSAVSFVSVLCVCSSAYFAFSYCSTSITTAVHGLSASRIVIKLSFSYVCMAFVSSFMMLLDDITGWYYVILLSVPSLVCSDVLMFCCHTFLFIYVIKMFIYYGTVVGMFSFILHPYINAVDLVCCALYIRHLFNLFRIYDQNFDGFLSYIKAGRYTVFIPAALVESGYGSTAVSVAAAPKKALTQFCPKPLHKCSNRFILSPLKLISTFFSSQAAVFLVRHITWHVSIGEDCRKTAVETCQGEEHLKSTPVYLRWWCKRLAPNKFFHTVLLLEPPPWCHAGFCECETVKNHCQSCSGSG